MPAADDDQRAIPVIMKHLETLASRLGDGLSTDHVRRSVRELSRAVQHGDGVEPAVQRVLSSIRQLQGEERSGPRRHLQAARPAIERLLNGLEQELLPALQRTGRL